MKNPKITIERLAIRLQGVTDDSAHTLVAGLGEELLVRLAEYQSLFAPGKVINIDSMNLGNIKSTNGQDYHQLKSAIASAVTQAIVQEIGDR
jgi:hypothetical protein